MARGTSGSSGSCDRRELSGSLGNAGIARDMIGNAPADGVSCASLPFRLGESLSLVMASASSFTSPEFCTRITCIWAARSVGTSNLPLLDDAIALRGHLRLPGAPAWHCAPKPRTCA